KPGPASVVGNTTFPTSYVAGLDGLLTQRYTAQASSIVSVDAGVGGETVAQGAARLPGDITTWAPQGVLLLEAANDRNGGANPTTVVNTLRTMVVHAKGRGLTVFVGTLLPMRVGGRNAGG